MNQSLKSFKDITILELLDHIPDLADVTPEAKHAIAECCDKVHDFPADIPIINQNTTVAIGYILISGLVAVERQPEGGTKEVYAYYGPGTCIAENAFVGNQRSMFTYKSRTRCHLLEINQTFRKIVEDHASVPLSFWNSASDWIAKFVEQREKRVRLDKSHWMTLRLLEIATAIDTRIVSDYRHHTAFPFAIEWWTGKEQAGDEVGIDSRGPIIQLYSYLRGKKAIRGGQEIHLDNDESYLDSDPGGRVVELMPGCKTILESVIANALKKPAKKPKPQSRATKPD